MGEGDSSDAHRPSTADDSDHASQKPAEWSFDLRPDRGSCVLTRGVEPTFECGCCRGWPPIFSVCPVVGATALALPLKPFSPSPSCCCDDETCFSSTMG